MVGYKRRGGKSLTGFVSPMTCAHSACAWTMWTAAPSPLVIKGHCTEMLFLQERNNNKQKTNRKEKERLCRQVLLQEPLSRDSSNKGTAAPSALLVIIWAWCLHKGSACMLGHSNLKANISDQAATLCHYCHDLLKKSKGGIITDAIVQNSLIAQYVMHSSI